MSGAANINTQTMQRLHYFDYLRVLAVFMGIIMHSTMAFTTADFYFWYLKVNNPSVIADNIVLLVHVYYMPLFFLIAGYFASQMYQKYQWLGLLRNRASRIGLPFLILMLILIPIHTQDVFYYIYNHQISSGVAIPTGPHFANWFSSQIKLLYQSGQLWQYYNNNNTYWFLYYLLLYYVGILLLQLMIDGLNKVLPVKVKQWLNLIFTNIYQNPLVIAMILFGLLSNSQTWYLDISYKFFPPLHIIFFYAVFFLMGWFMQRQNSLTVCTKHCVIYFVITLCVLLPTYYILRTYSVDYGNSHYWLYKMICLLLYALIASYLIFSTTGLTMHYLNKDSRIIRYLADSSYWLYIAQIPIIVLAQIIFIHISWPIFIQFICILLFSVMALLILYKYLVRHTWISQLLNGTRHLNEV